MWLGMIGGIVVLALVIAGVSAYLVKKPKKWTLSTPPATLAGMPRNTNPLEQTGFSAAVSKFRSDVTSLSNYGQLNSTVSALYTLGTSQTVGFVGFNGNFKVQVVLKSSNGLKVTDVSAGSHGGTAECGVSTAVATAQTICQWATGSTVGIVVFIPTGTGAPEPAADAAKIMLKVRDQVEKPAH